MIEVVDKALNLLSKEQDPLKKICSSSCYFNPLVWLYDEMKKNKDIVPISELSKEEKRKLWNLVIKERPEMDKYGRVLIIMAVHAYKTVNQ